MRCIVLCCVVLVVGGSRRGGRRTWSGGKLWAAVLGMVVGAMVVGSGSCRRRRSTETAFDSLEAKEKEENDY